MPVHHKALTFNNPDSGFQVFALFRPNSHELLGRGPEEHSRAGKSGEKAEGFSAPGFRDPDSRLLVGQFTVNHGQNLSHLPVNCGESLPHSLLKIDEPATREPIELVRPCCPCRLSAATASDL